MAFIEINTVKKTDDAGHVYSVTDTAHFVICKSPGKLKYLLDAIEPGTSVHYVSKGDWSMHDLVMQLLKTMGPSEIYFTTYALRETPVRQLVMGMNSGAITKIKMLVDTRAKIRTPEVFELAKMNFCEIAQINIHAKVCVVKSAKGSVCITGSANWTANPKIEAGVVSMNDELANFHIDWINKLIQNADIFK